MESRFWFSKRFLVAVLMFFGEMNTFSLKANLNIAIIEMTNTRNMEIGNKTITRETEFKWNSHMRGFILGAHAYGGILSIFVGYMAMKFGGSTVIFIGSLISSTLALFNPVAVRCSFYLFLAVRIIEGVAEIFKNVSFPELWTHWAPMKDRSKLMAIGYSGKYAGPAITYPICGYVMHKFGWPAAFYVTGGMSLLWTIVWFFLVPNEPSSDKGISKEELMYIQQDDKQGRPESMLTVWKNMLTCRHVYALGFVKIVYNVGLTVVVTCLPMYIRDINKIQIHKVGLYSAIPNVVNIFTMPLIGYMIDYLQNNRILTITQAHKLFMCSGFILGGILLFVMTYVSHSLTMSLVCLSLFKVTVSANYVTAHLNCNSLAPQCASVLEGYLSLFHMVGTTIAPLFIAFVVTDHTAAQWNTCFMTFGLVSFFGAAVYYVFGSSEPQSWAYSLKQDRWQRVHGDCGTLE